SSRTKCPILGVRSRTLVPNDQTCPVGHATRRATSPGPRESALGEIDIHDRETQVQLRWVGRRNRSKRKHEFEPGACCSVINTLLDFDSSILIC
ncbi:hypothetical protein PSTT_14437, partial [Puccinia striiformis]